MISQSLFNYFSIVSAGLLALPAVNAQAVFAHFMAANSYSYSSTDWSNDITTAQGIGIDGFALNLNADDYEAGQVSTAYSVAESLGFKLFLSFDLSYTWTADDIVSMVAAVAGSSAQYEWNGKPLVSTYSGESYGDSFWLGVKDSLSSEGFDICFAPAFTTYRDPSLAGSLLSTFSSIDGFFNWWSWPADTDTNLTTATDVAYMDAIADSRTGPYIMGVSHWQFKNLPDTGDEWTALDNDWVEYSDTLASYRWQQAVELKPDIIEYITWNDYAESHYIGDVNPNVDLGDYAPYYVDGIDHSGWRTVAQYYISYYKTGVAPAITEDTIVYWYRIFPKDITCSIGEPPRNDAFPADSIFAMFFLTSSATVSIDIGQVDWNHNELDSVSGVQILSVPFSTDDGEIPYFAITRDGVVTSSGYGTTPIYHENCDYYNFNPIALVA